MTQKRKLDLKELELQLPSIDSNETKIILGGNDYGGDSVGNFDMWYWGGNNNGADAAHDNYQDQGNLDHYYDVDGDGVEDNAGDGDTDGRHAGEYSDLPNGVKEYMLQNLPEIDVQTANECWMEAAEFLYEFFDKDGVVSDSDVEQFNNDVMDWFKDEHGVQNSWEALLRGLELGEHTDNFMNQFFENDKLSDISELVNALTEGHPVYAAVDSIHDNEDKTNHAVIIVGFEYDQDGNFVFICADSSTGQIERYPADHIDYDGVYAIFGLK